MDGVLRFELLGPLRALRGGEELAVGGPKQRAVLTALLLEQPRVVSMERLIEAVWGDEPADTARRTLQVYVSNLRKATRPDLIVGRGSGYALELGDDTLDLADLTELTSTTTRSFDDARYDEAIVGADRTLALFRGPPLLELGDRDYFVPDRARLDDARLWVEVTRHEALLMSDRDPVSVIPDLERVAGVHPLDERLHALLMTSQYRAGRQADALDTYAQLRLRLVEELGLDPCLALQTLEQRIIEQDPALLTPAGGLDATRTVRVSSAAPEPTAWVEIEGRSVLLHAAVTTIGRLPDRSIVVADPDVSRRHAEIRRTPSGYALVDCDSTNGVTVNGALVPRAQLVNGDVIEIGNASLRFVLDG